MIQAILFDLGNVIVGFDIARGYRAIEAHSPLDAAEMRRRITRSGLVQTFERGELSGDEFFQRISSLLELRLSQALALMVGSSARREAP